MKYKAIFWDIDDTLLDYIPCCREAFDSAMQCIDCGYAHMPAEEEQCLFDLFFAISGRLFSEAKHGLHTIAEVMELYPAEYIDRAGYPLELVSPFKHAFREAWGRSHTLVADSQEVLACLHDRGYRLFAASNSFGHLQRSRLEHAGILNFFEDTFISMDLGYDKPDIRFYQEALRRSGLLPCDVLMVGDSMTTDILGAQLAGIDTCWFNPSGEQRDEAKPTFSIQRLSQLPELLEL